MADETNQLEETISKGPGLSHKLRIMPKSSKASGALSDLIKVRSLLAFFLIRANSLKRQSWRQACNPLELSTLLDFIRSCWEE